ncbi:MAG: glycosyltransferase [bacterium]|nr:glycosyltransferase [bacterium]
MNKREENIPMRVAIFVLMPPNAYSGGRYHALMTGEALADGGHEVYMVINQKPIFWDDFQSFPQHQNVKVHLSPDFNTNLPEGEIDCVIFVPGMAMSPDFYYRPQLFAIEKNAHLVFINFESGNWFNALSGEPRKLSLWKPWQRICKLASAVVSISKEGNKWAQDFYPNPSKETRFDYCYPTINTPVADAVPDVRREKRIVILTRFSMAAHKGSNHLLELLTDALRGYTIVFLVGTGDVPPDISDDLVSRAEDCGISVEFRYKLSDYEKFVEYKKAELLVFPSYFEGFGYPPVEALYCNLPCVAFRLPVLEETCGHRLTYAKHGDWSDFREKINEVLASDPPRIETFHYVKENFSLDSQTRRLEEILLPLMDTEPAIVRGNKTLRAAGFRVRMVMAAITMKRRAAGRRIRRVMAKITRKLRVAGSRIWRLMTTKPKKRFARRLVMKPVKKIQDYFRRKRSESAASTWVSYYPGFRTKEELTNHYYRACWYLPFSESKCRRVTMFRSYGGSDYHPGPCPDYMSATLGETSHIVIEQGRINNIIRALKSNVVLLWRKNLAAYLLKPVMQLLGIRVVNVDTEDISSQEYREYCGIYWYRLLTSKEKEEIIFENYQRFRQVALEVSSKNYSRSCICGTGPSLEKAYDFDFSDCLTIVCNSIVQNKKLLDHLQPQFVCAGDVVSHWGVSKYAAVFRRDLVKLLQQRTTYLVTSASFGYLFRLNHPEVKDKIILIDQLSEGPVHNLIQQYELPMLASTLNIHMIPLASTFTNEILLIGNDGKGDRGDNEDFWPHAKGNQYYDLVETGHRCHPTFDVHRQETTYPRFIRSCEKSILNGEQEHGKIYRTLLPSNIPVLKSRQVPPGWDRERNFQGNRVVSSNKESKG